MQKTYSPFALPAESFSTDYIIHIGTVCARVCAMPYSRFKMFNVMKRNKHESNLFHRAEEAEFNVNSVGLNKGMAALDEHLRRASALDNKEVMTEFELN